MESNKLVVDKKNRYLIFGSLLIHDYLLQDNIILLLSNSKSRQTIFPRTNISNPLRIVIKTILMTQEINYKLLQDLDETEKKLFKKIMKRSHLNSILNFEPNKMDYSYDDIVTMYDVLKGEIQAGNDSKKVLADLKKTLKLMVDNDMIEESEAKDLLESL